MSELAKKLIEESLRTKNPVLDLGNCGLDGTEPILERLGECDHLEVLSFSDEWQEFDNEVIDWNNYKSKNQGIQNNLIKLPQYLPAKIQKLIASGCKIIECAPIANLKELRELYIPLNKIEDIRFLTNLKQLTKLDLAFNRIHNLNPLTELKSLEMLDIKGNQISDIQVISNLEKITRLALGNNKITNITALKYLHKLTILNLSNYEINDLKSEFEKVNLNKNFISNFQALSNLKRLKRLLIYNNQISDIQFLTKLDCLVELDLNDNKITNLQPLEALASLNELLLYNNNISEIKSLESLHEITILNLNNNRILDINPLKKLRMLKRLYLGGNYDVEITPLQDLRNLIELSLFSIQNVNLKIFKQLQKLNKLNLNNTHISEIEPLESLSQLLVLNLGNNKILNIKLLKNFSQLTTLNLENNQISNIESIENLNQLTTLNLENNRISIIKPIENLNQLVALNLKNNQISDIKPIENLGQLTTLHLENNQISDIKPIENLNQLVALNLKNNQISDIKPIENLGQLTTLHLENNQISDIKSIENLGQLTTLHLENNQISDIPSFNRVNKLEFLNLNYNKIDNIQNIQNLTQLKVLSVNNNQIHSIKHIRKLLKLENLYLSRNQIKDFNEIGNFPRLKILNLDDNEIENTEVKEVFPKLRSLMLKGNQIKEIKIAKNFPEIADLFLNNNQISDLKNIEGPSTMKRLHLTQNQITELENLDQFPQLTTLFLDDNQIKEINGLKNLSQLNHLSLENNKISKIENAESLINLVQINLNENLIKEIEGLLNLKRLTHLEVAQNQIKDVRGVEFPPLLDTLNLQDNLIKNISLDFINSLQNLEIFAIDDNPIQNLPPEIINKGPKIIRNHLQSIEDQESQYELNEAKLIFVGVGEVGKTELAEALSEENYVFVEGRKTTQGIRIKDWVLPDCQKDDKTFDFTTHIWDFAGQEINYGTHQFFLTKNSVYVFLWDGRKGESCKFDYWLQVIELLSEKAPVFVVQNKVDIYQVEINQQNWKDRFENIVDFKKTSCKNGTGIAELRDSVRQQLLDLPHIGEIWNKHRVAVRKTLEEKEANYISLQEYVQICKENKVNQESGQFLSRQLHDIGVILHFGDDFTLRDTIVLNPEWATKAAYILLDNEKENSLIVEGRFHQNILTELWNDPSFDGKHLFLLRLIERFELIFNLEDTPEYIIPELLPINPPSQVQNIQLDKTQRYLRFEYHYEFMPKGVFSRFICRIHKRIHQNLYWKYGVILEYKNSLAKVLWNDTANIQTIKIEAWGPEVVQLLFLVRDELEHIHKKLNHPPIKEKVPCSCSACRDSKTPHLYNYQTLIRYQKNNRADITCENSLKDILVNSLLNGILESEQKEQEILKDLINDYRVHDFFEMTQKLKIKDPQLSALRKQFIQSKDGFTFADQLKTWMLDYFSSNRSKYFL